MVSDGAKWGVRAALRLADESDCDILHLSNTAKQLDCAANVGNL
jgi:hypothetical protein